MIIYNNMMLQKKRGNSPDMGLETFLLEYTWYQRHSSEIKISFLFTHHNNTSYGKYQKVHKFESFDSDYSWNVILTTPPSHKGADLSSLGLRMAASKAPKPIFIIPTMICIVCVKREGGHCIGSDSSEKNFNLLWSQCYIILILVLKHQTVG